MIKMMKTSNNIEKTLIEDNPVKIKWINSKKLEETTNIKPIMKVRTI